MSTKSEKVWVILGWDGSLAEITNSRTRNLCIASFIPRMAMPWKALRKQGYRCVRATITYEVPDEKP